MNMKEKIFMKNNNGYGALLDRTLIIKENSRGLVAELWDSSVAGWKSKPRKPLRTDRYVRGYGIGEILKDYGFTNEMEVRA